MFTDKSGQILRFLTVIGVMFSAFHVCGEDARDTRISRDGTVVIAWHKGYAEFTELVVYRNEEPFLSFPVIKNSGWTLSGLQNGAYDIALSSPRGSQVLFHLKVQHYPLSTALAFFSVGLLMFGLLIFTLRRGRHSE